MRLQDKVAVITGAARGIGKAIAMRFAKEGAKVVVDDILDDLGQRTADEIRQQGGDAIFMHADVSKEEEVKALMQAAVERFGKLNVLVNNAICSEEDIVKDSFEPNIEVNLKGTYLCCRTAIPHIAAAGGGSIINISSVNALMGFQGIHCYSATKAAIIGLTRSLAVWHGKDKIRVNVICPGTIQTEVWEYVLKQRPTIFDELLPWYPIGRLGVPEDIANAALFLASDESSFCTGAVFVIDGGLTAGNATFGHLE